MLSEQEKREMFEDGNNPERRKTMIRNSKL